MEKTLGEKSMIQTLWIWSARNRWWNNGVIRITEEYMQKVPWDRTRDELYSYNGLKVCIDNRPAYPELLRKPEPVWVPKTPAEIIAILDGK